MASRTLAGLSAILSAARSLPEALLALAQEATEADRSASVALYEHDPQRGVLFRRTAVSDESVRATPLNVALDHLPARVRKTLLEGKAFADCGAQSEDYMKLLGFSAPEESGAFLLRGCALDGELAAIVALYEPKRVFGPRVSERLSAATDLFVLALEKLCERGARLEAVSRLEELTRRIHQEHARAIADLERRLAQARATLSGGGSEADARITQMESAAEKSRMEARATAQRLSAVEEQVASAVGRLEKAHRQLYEQGEALTQQRNLLYRVERMLRDSSDAESGRLVEDLLAVVSSSAAHTDSQ